VPIAWLFCFFLKKRKWLYIEFISESMMKMLYRAGRKGSVRVSSACVQLTHMQTASAEKMPHAVSARIPPPSTPIPLLSDMWTFSVHWHKNGCNFILLYVYSTWKLQLHSLWYLKFLDTDFFSSDPLYELNWFKILVRIDDELMNNSYFYWLKRSGHCWKFKNKFAIKI
jgi:hypothetical protein